MIYVVGLISLALLVYATWTHYLAIMMLKQRRCSMPKITQYLGYVVLYIGYVLDFLFNVAASIIFLELPREFLFTCRVSRHIKETGWRADLSRWCCDNFLNPFDPGHCE